MTADDPVERAFAQLRAENAKRPAPSPPPAELDALLDAREHQAERERLAAAVVHSQQARQQLAHLLAVDAEVEATRHAAHRRRWLLLLGTSVVAAAALVLAFVLFGGPGRELALRGRIEVAEAEGPKDPGYPGYTRAQWGEHLRLSAAVDAAVRWLAIDVVDGRVWRQAGRGNQPLALAALLPREYRGVLLVAATTEDEERILMRLQELRTPEVRAAATGTAVGAAVARLLEAVVLPSSFGNHTLVHVLEIF